MPAARCPGTVRANPVWSGRCAAPSACPRFPVPGGQGFKLPLAENWEAPAGASPRDRPYRCAIRKGGRPQDQNPFALFQLTFVLSQPKVVWPQPKVMLKQPKVILSHPKVILPKIKVFGDK
jgi:hypothetical protein